MQFYVFLFIFCYAMSTLYGSFGGAGGDIELAGLWAVVSAFLVLITMGVQILVIGWVFKIWSLDLNRQIQYVFNVNLNLTTLGVQIMVFGTRLSRFDGPKCTST